MGILHFFRLKHQSAKLTNFLRPEKYSERYAGYSEPLDIFKFVDQYEMEKAQNNPQKMTIEVVGKHVTLGDGESLSDQRISSVRQRTNASIKVTANDPEVLRQADPNLPGGTFSLE